MLNSQILKNELSALFIRCAHRVQVDHLLLFHQSSSNAPVNPKMDRKEQPIHRKDVDFFRPAFDALVSVLFDFRVEERFEAEDSREFFVGLCALHHQVEVTIDDHVIQPCFP